MSGTRAVVMAAGALLLLRAPAGALDVRVITVLASDAGPSDPQLAALRPHLAGLVSYSSFRVVRSERRRCLWKNQSAFQLPGGRALYVIPKGMDDTTALVQIQLMDGRKTLMETDMRLPTPGRVFFGVGRDGHEGEGAMIVVLKARDVSRGK